ncbi:MAG: hydrogenase [Planctomycetes bacterium]|mgnify:FL=1|nr:hydrogenase [Planctomycetota bacterium]
MVLFLVGCGFAVLGGVIALLVNGSKPARWIATIGVWIGCGLASIPVISALGDQAPHPVQWAWSMPGGSLSFALDGLSAFFCLPILLVSPLAALYGVGYLAGHARSLKAVLFFYNVLVASMLMLVATRNGLLFLVVWEIMAISSFFLVIFDDEHAHVRRAGWTYLVATHIGTAALLAMFALLGAGADSLDFTALAAMGRSLTMATVLFALAVIGFGSKAGFFALHVWLPQAHPAAPSHVSALMSGVMIKTGIYGLLRVLTLLGAPSAGWGWTLVIVGLSSGILGVAFALAQHDIKRLLAYHSVENIGIITLGLGAGVLGLSWGQPVLIMLGFGGGILHVLNHAVFKSLLFFGAGAVAHSTGLRDIDHLGGLLKRMRWTGLTFLVASAAICGLPPFNGFVSEFLIYVAAFSGLHAATPGTVVLAIGILTGLALIGGLAAACFAKAFGMVFLGEPRSDHAGGAHEVGPTMRWPMMALAVACLAIGLLAPLAVRGVLPAVAVVAGGDPGALLEAAGGAIRGLTGVVYISVTLLLVTGGLLLFRRLLPRGKQQTETGTWDCGYARPTPRMQYTASSFAQPLVDLFRTLLGTRKRGMAVRGFFPARATFETDTPDAAQERLFAPLFQSIDRLVAPIRRMQHGRVHEYLLYIAATLVLLLLFWKAGTR